MAIWSVSSLSALLRVFLLCWCHTVAKRGDEDESATVSLQMLPRGGLHAGTQLRSLGSTRKFHMQATHASFLDLGLQRSLGNSASNRSASPSGQEHGITVSLKLPYEGFATVGHESNNLHIQTSSGQHPQSSVAVALAPASTQHSDDASPLAAAWVGRDFKDLFNTISYTVIRIQTVTAEVNWFEPYQQPQDLQMTGSGWAVDLGDVPGGEDKDPIFLTNAHVVRDAHDVEIQLPAIGLQFFDAYVPLICDDFDLAVVKLVDPDKFFKALQETNLKKLHAFQAEETPLELGLEVASVGFPLGSTSLKLSRGVISGTEEVGDFICYQTTAPISPGSSGGPLFALRDDGSMRVVGATFASAASKGAQNTNYVVPTIAITQVLAKYRANRATEDREVTTQGDAKVAQEVPSQIRKSSHVSGESGGGRGNNQQLRIHPKLMKDPTHKRVLGQMQVKEFAHEVFKIAPVDAVGIEGNKALYDSYGCDSGVFLSKILDTSVFKNSAKPEVAERTFLVEVNGIKLDEFGMGHDLVGGAFLKNPVPFESLMMMHAKPGDKLQVKTCAENGKIESHDVDMGWDEEKYGSGKVGVRNIVEPHWNPKAMEYESFAGVTVMQMSINHIIKLLRVGQPPTLGRWLLPENQLAKHLIITHVEKATYASRVLSPGMVVKSINGIDVGTLQDYRDAFEKINSKHSWTLETDRGVFFATDFVEALVKQIALAENGLSFLFCDSVIKAAESMFGDRHQNQTGNTPLSNSHDTASLAQLAGSRREDAVNVIERSVTLAGPTERVSKLAKVEALKIFARGQMPDGDHSEDEYKQEARRKARVAHAGFLVLPSSAYDADMGLGLPL